jgi:hypothetical protein
MVSGTVKAQQPSPFTNQSLNGRFVAYEDGPASTGQGLPDPDKSDAVMALYNADGQGNCALIARDENAGGQVNVFTQTNVPNVIPCAVDSGGRGTFGTKVFYLTGPASGFYVSQNMGTLGYLEGQAPPLTPASGYSNADTLGFKFEGSLAPSTAKMTVYSGTFNALGSLVFEWSDVSDAQGGLQSGTNTQKSFTTDQLGRTTLPDFLGGNEVVYAISPDKFILIDEFKTVTAPSLQVMER